MEQIILSISIFTALVLVLVLILNFAESQLLPQGSVTIEINNEPDKSLETVDLPDPILPKTATFSPAPILKLRSFKAGSLAPG